MKPNKVTFTNYQKQILKERKGLDVDSIAGRSKLISIEKKFRDVYFKTGKIISLAELINKIKKDYPTLQETKGRVG